MTKRFPDCPEGRSDCRLEEGPTVSTAMAWQPEYGRDGSLLNEDPNTHRAQVLCRQCGCRWTRIWQAGRDARFDEHEPMMWSRRYAQKTAEAQGRAAADAQIAAIGGSGSNTVYEKSDNGSLTPAAGGEIDLVEQIKGAILEDEDYLRKLARKLVETPE